MGVDYTSNYGLGFKIPDYVLEYDNPNEFSKLPKFITKQTETIYDMDEVCEIITDILKKDGIICTYFDVGWGSYGGDNNRYYIIVESPFVEGVYQSELVEKFKIKMHELLGDDLTGPLDIVGGLLID